MAKAFKCDGCRKLVEGEPTGKFLLESVPGNLYMRNTGIVERSQGELCGTCARRLSEFAAQLGDVKPS